MSGIQHPREVPHIGHTRIGLRYVCIVTGRAVLMLVLCACGSRNAESLVPAAANAKLPDGPPLVTPGERMSYRLQVGGMDLATYDMAVGEIDKLGDRRAIVVQSHAKSKPLVSMVTNIDDVYTSWIDVETGRPLRWTIAEHTADGAVKEAADARFTERNGDSMPVEVTLLDKPPITETQKLSMPEVWDYNALVIALRSWEAKRGATAHAEVMRSSYLWHVAVTVHGEEQVATDLGDFPALRFDGLSYRINRDGSRDTESPERRFSVWISNDDGRVPIQNIAESDYGQLKMTIVDYQPGNGNRVRP